MRGELTFSLHLWPYACEQLTLVHKVHSWRLVLNVSMGPMLGQVVGLLRDMGPTCAQVFGGGGGGGCTKAGIISPNPFSAREA